MTEVNEVNFSKGGKMAQEGGGKGRLIKIIIIAVVVLVLLVGGIVLAMFLFDTGEEAAAPNKEMAQARTETGIIETPFYLDMGSFVVNLSDGRRYLKTSIQLLINDEKANEFLRVRQAEIKDLVVAELQTLNSEQLRDPQERELLKQRLLRKIETLLPTEDREWDDPMPVKKVLITEFYLQ